jgi:BlaI family transcriptional regulator, penicillinase repressor
LLRGENVPRTPSDVTDAELSILQVLWERGEATVREITEQLYPQSGVSEYATVKKLAARLETKGFLERDDSQRAHVLRATIGRDDLIGRRLQDVADSLCQGQWSSLLTQFVNAKGLTAKQQRMLHALIDELEQQEAKKKQK